MLLEVYRCVQLKRWSVVCGCVLQRGQRGEGWCVSSTLCRYDRRMGLLLVLNWARVHQTDTACSWLVCHSRGDCSGEHCANCIHLARLSGGPASQFFGAPTPCGRHWVSGCACEHHHHRVIKLVFSIFPRISLLYR